MQQHQQREQQPGGGGALGRAVDPTLPGGFASLVERQELVAELWVKGFGVAEIARSLGINRETVRRDVLAYQPESAADHLPDLENARARTLELHRRVQQEAWMMFAQLPDNALNKPKALDTVLQAEMQIGRIEGLFAPEAASAAGVVELQRLVMDTLEEVGGSDLQRRFLAALARRSQTALGTTIAASMSEPLPGDADAGDAGADATTPATTHDAAGDDDAAPAADTPGADTGTTSDAL